MALTSNISGMIPNELVSAGDLWEGNRDLLRKYCIETSFLKDRDVNN